MKIYKKVIACLLAAVLLCGGQAQCAMAAGTSEGDISTIGQTATTNVKSTKSGVTVEVVFTYTDGESAYFSGVTYKGASLYTDKTVSDHFSGDTRYVTITMKHKQTGATLTFNLWCDIYGQTGTN